MKGKLSSERRLKYEQKASGCNILHPKVRVYGQQPVRVLSLSLERR